MSARILVVDDDASARLLVRAALKRAGFAVAEATDGRTALDVVRTRMPDLVMMDVNMPELDGFSACAELRDMAGGDRIPVMMMTGLEDVDAIARAFEVGATDFVTKPINWMLLPHRVRYLLRASSAINDLERSQRRLSNAQRIGMMGDWEWDVRLNRFAASSQARRIFGHDAGAQAIEREAFFAPVHAEDAGRLRDAWRQAVESGEGFSIEHRVVRGGIVRHVHQQVEVGARDETGRALELAGAVSDVTRHKDAEEQIRRLAYFDTLTGLPNRLLFTEQLHKALANADRRRSQVAVLFIDLDNFKRVNDTLGHNAGDELLRVASTRLAHSIRPLDSVSRSPGGADEVTSIARLGGDEFIVMLGEMRDIADAANAALRLVNALSEPVTIQGTEIFVGASVGVALFPDDGLDIDTLLKNADTAMYRAKQAGRGGVQFYDASMNARALERLAMETMLRRAVERNELVLHYQPRISLASMRIVGVEALLRWQHPERGLLAPAEFLGLAEEAGLMGLIGEWAIKAACRQCAAWLAAGLEPGSIAVNLSASHLRDRNLPPLVQTALEENGLAGSRLEIEVTESILMTDPQACVANAQRLNDVGVLLAIDDFGTGYSSLSYLKRLPISSLKIDQSFVRDIATDPDDAAIVLAIVAMGHTLKLKVVAEGVETEAQREFLKANGCDEIQGYLASRPVDAKAFADLLEQQGARVEQPVPV